MVIHHYGIHMVVDYYGISMVFFLLKEWNFNGYLPLFITIFTICWRSLLIF